MSRAAALARSTFALSEFLTSVFSGSAFYMTLLPSLTLPLVTGASPARTNQAERVDGWLRRKRQLKDESRSSDIGNVPVLEAPSIPTLYRRFQITAALSDTAVWVCILASLFCSGTSLLAAYAPSGLVSSCPRLAALLACTLVLVCPSSGLLPGPPNEMKHTSEDGNTRCLEEQLSHTRAPRRHLSRQERTQIIRPHPEALCCAAATHWKPDYGPDICGYGAHSPAPDTPAITP
jgi:hypothetical protein